MHVIDFCGKITKKQKDINMNIKQALEYGIELLKEKNIDEPLLRTRIILANILNESKEYLMIHEKEELSEELEELYITNIQKLCNGMPLQYITNKQEFMGLEFYVDENVLIPQPDTEILVEEVIDISKREGKKNILDLCTGSGAIGISIANNISECNITLSDISKDALEVAKENCTRIVGATITQGHVSSVAHKFAQLTDGRPQKNIEIIKSDLFNNFNQNNKFDIIVSNPPYIKTDVIRTLDKEVQNEPTLALDGGLDGLDVYRKIISEAYKFLEHNGYLCLEIGYDQKDEVIKLIEHTGEYKDIYSKKDLASNDRIVVCRNCQKSIE